MDSSILFFAIVIAIIIIVIRAKSPEGKGRRGEGSIANIAANEVRKGLYGHVLRNLYVPKEDGGTSEIDVVLVSIKGIFVFESKNYAGYIFGNDRYRNWTVTLYAGKSWMGSKKVEKHTFYNPVWQNRTHIRALRNLLETSAPLYSIVVFSDRGALKNVIYDSDKVTILNTSQLKYNLSNIRFSFSDVLSPEEVDRIAQILFQYSNADDATKQAHLNGIRRKELAPEICPWCGEKLVVRTAKQGPREGKQFYGCSNYPKCRYIRNINELI